MGYSEGVIPVTIILMLLLLIPVFSSLQVTASLHLNDAKLKSYYYNIYGLRYLTYIKERYNVSRVFYIEDKSLIAVGGDGFLSLVDPSTLDEYFRESILGSVVSLGYDALHSPRWVIVGSSKGEIVGLSIPDKYSIDYVTPTGASIKDIYVASRDGNSWALAVDEDSYLYVYRLGFDGWATIGPKVGGSVSGIEGIPVLWVAGLRYYKEDIYYDPERFLVVTDSSKVSGDAESFLRGDLYVEAYYIDELFRRLHPAAAGSINISESEVEIRELSFAVEVMPYSLTYVNGTIDSGNLINLKSMPRTSYRIHVLYFVKVVDKELNVTISRKCYYGYTDVNLDSTITLTNVTLTYQDNVTLCLSGLSPRPADIGVSELLLLNVTKAPETLDLEVKLYPWPRSSGGLQDSPIYSLIRLKEKANGMPETVESLLATASASRDTLLVYLLDRDLNPIRFSNSSYVVGGVVEPIVINGEVSAVDVSFNGEYIIASSRDGRVLVLKWDEDSKRYIYKWSLRVSNSPIRYISVVDNRHAIIVAIDGVSQLIDFVNDTVLWPSGDSRFAGLDITDGRIISIDYIDPHIIYAVDSNGRIIEFNHELKAYAQLVLNISIAFRVRDNSTIGYEGNNVLVSVFDGSTKKAELKLLGNESRLYLPKGSIIDLVVNINGIGRVVYTDIAVNQKLGIIQDTIYLRRVVLEVYTPGKADNPLLTMAYSLVSGPVESANVTLTADIHSKEGSVIAPYTINLTTDGMGRTVAIVFDDLEYDIYVEKKGYHRTHTILKAHDDNITVELYPILYNVLINSLDLDAASKNVTYHISNISYIITLIETGRSISIEGNPLTIFLPEGTYIVSSSSPYYKSNSTLYSIDHNTSITILVKPEIYDIILEPIVVDRRLSLASGPLTDALINITLIEPYKNNIGVYTYGERIALRYGVYMLKIIDKRVKLQDDTIIAHIYKDGVYSLELSPGYSELELNLFDIEDTEYRIDRFNFMIEYIYYTWSNLVALNMSNNPLSIILPMGVYRISIESAGYNTESLYVTLYENMSLNIYMKPIYRNYDIYVVFDDKLVSLASGGIPHANIRLELVKPSINRSYATITDNNGIASIFARSGLYKLSISSPYAQSLETFIVLDGGYSMITVYVEPKYYTLNITAIDSETLDKLNSYILEIQRLGPGTPSAMIVNASSGYTLTLPAGRYELKGYVEGFYKPRPFIIELANNDSIDLIVVPVKISLDILVIEDKAWITYNNTRYLLPSTPIANAIITLKGIKPQYITGLQIQRVSNEDGRASFNNLRPGLYMVKIEKTGYTTYSGFIEIRINGTRIFYIKPVITNVVFKPIDTLKKDLSAISDVLLKINNYNGVKVNIKIRYSYPSIIHMPSGLYEIIISANGYLDKRKLLFLEGSLKTRILEVGMEPVRYNVEITLEYMHGDKTGLVRYGVISVEPVDPNLAISEEVVVFRGKSKLRLPAGDYKIYYSISSKLSNLYKVKVGKITVRSDTEVVLKLSIAYTNITLILKDSIVKLQVNDSTIQILYSGPFGFFNKTIEVKGGSANIQLPPGYVDLMVESMYYKPLHLNMTVVNDTIINAYLDPLTVNIALKIVNEDGFSVLEPVMIRLKHSLYPVTYYAESNNSIVFIENIRQGNYSVEIKPLNRNSIYDITKTNITIDLQEPAQLDIVFSYKRYNVTIEIMDSETNSPLTNPHIVTLQNENYTSITIKITVSGRTVVRIPPGNYTIRLAPVNTELYNIYDYDKKYSASISRPMKLTIPVSTRMYLTTISVIERSNPVIGARVTIYIGDTIVSTGFTDSRGIYKVKLKPGEYRIEVSKEGYKASMVYVKIPSMKPIVVRLNPEPFTILLNWAPLVIILIILITIILYKYK